MQEPGLVSLVGAGPGDPGLITVKGRDRLAAADVVVYDRLVHPSLLDLAPEGAERIFIGKAYGRHVLEQEEMNNLLVFLAASGKRVVRLKGGDPFVFGRGSEEAETLAARGIPFEIVPGVPSGVAAPAYAGIPVTDRRYTTSVTFVTGHRHPDDPESAVDWDALGRAGGTIVVFMGSRNFSGIAEALLRAGRSHDHPVALITSGTDERQEVAITDLRGLGGFGEIPEGPTLVVIGDVVALHDKLDWFAPAAREALVH